MFEFLGFLYFMFHGWCVVCVCDCPGISLMNVGFNLLLIWVMKCILEYRRNKTIYNTISIKYIWWVGGFGMCIVSYVFRE